jgi:hypothetical protein
LFFFVLSLVLVLLLFDKTTSAGMPFFVQVALGCFFEAKLKLFAGYG